MAQLRKLAKISAVREQLRLGTGDLARIINICERAVLAAEEVDLQNISDEEYAKDDWAVNSLERVENAIYASNVIMLLTNRNGMDQQVSLLP